MAVAECSSWMQELGALTARWLHWLQGWVAGAGWQELGVLAALAAGVGCADGAGCSS